MVTAEFQQFVKLSGIVPQSVTVSGGLISGDNLSSRTPQAAIIWGNTRTTNVWQNQHNMILGFSNGTDSACIAATSEDNTTSTRTNAAHHNDKIYASYNEIISGSVSPSLALAAVSSFSSGKINLSWTKNSAPIDNEKINVMALYDISGVEVGIREVGTTTIGLQSYSLTNTNLKPDIILFISANIGTMDLPSVLYTTPASFSVGAAMSGKQWSIATASQVAVTPSNTSRYLSISGDGCLSLLGYDGTPTAHASFHSFTSGSFTLNWTTAPDISIRNFSYIAMAGRSFDIGYYQEPTPVVSGTVRISGGNQPNVIFIEQPIVTKTIPVSADIGKIRGLILFSQHNNVLGLDSNAKMTIGGASANNQGYSTTADSDGDAATITARFQDHSGVMFTFTPGGSPTFSNVTSISSITDLSSENSSTGQEQFTLDYSISDGFGRYVCYLAMGDPPKPPSAEPPKPVNILAPGQGTGGLLTPT